MSKETNQTIQCSDLSDFLNVIKELVKEGIHFESNGSTFLIELTGGY